jgi:hypothetical protein
VSEELLDALLAGDMPPLRVILPALVRDIAALRARVEALEAMWCPRCGARAHKLSCEGGTPAYPNRPMAPGGYRPAPDADWTFQCSTCGGRYASVGHDCPGAR